ncbi:hypothetical protein [Sorangium sp. So ce128]|uniref:hypothetical protein n=1 Tax=Sorangium sp. So ce128 TaxID=3133281 RepID=UPI003F6423CF
MDDDKSAAAQIIEKAMQAPTIDGLAMSNARILTPERVLAVELSPALKSARDHITDVLKGHERMFKSASLEASATSVANEVNLGQQKLISLGTISFTPRRHDGVPRGDAQWMAVRFLVADESATSIGVYVATDARLGIVGSVELVCSIDANSASAADDIARATEEAFLRLLNSLPTRA